jgi:ABC-2 type transport system ATP-binding protein
VRVADRGAFALAVPRIARDSRVTVLEMQPLDESLESVFSYLVRS